ncbi:MAG: tRNA pseudouridine(38-40) synthase TruA [Lachnospiraceae bacterium]|nr:tRNA pseudouridine(38-40) synthase TruA [Lachnospiraceae bacterium]
MINNYKVTLQYDGTRYSGWQRQGNTVNTIESKLSSVLSIMTDSQEPVEIFGSGRTDAGVHALGQVANFKLNTDMDQESVMEYMNRYLPEDIRVLDIAIVPIKFHSRLNATEKVYRYSIDNNPKADVFMRRYAWWIDKKLDLDKMRELVEVFVGKKDFITFSDVKNNKKSTERHISMIDVVEENGIVTLEFTGDGFLYHMVRKITAAFVRVGLGEDTIEDIRQALYEKDRHSFGYIAPAKGLMLKQVKY